MSDLLAESASRRGGSTRERLTDLERGPKRNAATLWRAWR